MRKAIDVEVLRYCDVVVPRCCWWKEEVVTRKAEDGLVCICEGASELGEGRKHTKVEGCV
jgi:hypothetical protein